MTAKKTTEKSTASKPAKTKTEKKFERLDLETFTVSATELGYILGLNTANISQLAQVGSVTKDADGRYNLKANVSGYCKALRERTKPKERKADDELTYWKTEKIKTQVKSWRISRDREIGMAIITALRAAMEKLKESLRYVPNVGDAIDGILDAIERVDIDQVSLTVEGEDTEDEDI